MSIAATGIEHRCTRGERQRANDRVDQRLRVPRIEKPSPRGDRILRVARRVGPAILRLQQIDVAAPRNIEDVSPRALGAALIDLERGVTLSHGAEEAHRQHAIIAVVRRPAQRLILLILGLSAFVVVSALLYQIGMDRLEGKPRTFWEAFEWAGESLSTTGYGADAKWSHPLMVILVVAVQFVGVFLVFLIIPIYLVPFLEERFEEKVPRTADEKLQNHVVIYGFGPAVETLIQRLAESHVPALVVETDEADARLVMEQGNAVVFTRSEEDVPGACRLAVARAIVANGADTENAALILRARQMGFDRDIFAFVEDPSHRKPMELAGATAVYTPRHIVAAALAAHASDRLSPRLPGLEGIDGLERRELRIAPGGALAGRRIGDVGLPAAIVGMWSRSRLVTRCASDVVLEPGAVLEVVGDREALEEVARLAGTPLLHATGPFLIAGFGEVGRKVHELLTDVGEEVRVIERQAGRNVDVVGDVLDASVLERAQLAEARALILALDSDDSTLFATVIARDLAADVPLIARVNHSRNLDNIHRAGADYALSIADISGQMLSARLLGRKARVREEHRRVIRVDGATFAGRCAGELGVAVLALERDSALMRRVEPTTVIRAGDAVWVCAV
jgi:Trk K+ transport system NAD-binding subunit